MVKKINFINISEVRDKVNLLLFNINGIGLKEMMLSNKLCELLGGVTNEVIDCINNYS